MLLSDLLSPECQPLLNLVFPETTDLNTYANIHNVNSSKWSETRFLDGGETFIAARVTFIPWITLKPSSVLRQSILSGWKLEGFLSRYPENFMSVIS